MRTFGVICIILGAVIAVGGIAAVSTNSAAQFQSCLDTGGAFAGGCPYSQPDIGTPIVAGAVVAGFGVLLLAIRRTDRKRIGDDERLRKCPFCAELVKIEATVCRYCQRDLPSPSPMELIEAKKRGGDDLQCG